MQVKKQEQEDEKQDEKKAWTRKRSEQKVVEEKIQNCFMEVAALEQVCITQV